ncbi:MAG: hypothetical protein IPO18_12330 [bacterium]|nr:hypothetical protein [bacterium]
MRRLLLLTFLSGWLLPCESYACCGRIETPQEAFDGATVVFSGTVIERIDHSVEDEVPVRPGLSEYIFKVESVWKGPIRDTFSVYPMDRFRIGETYIIYARVWGLKATGEFLVGGGPCSRCMPLEQAVWDRAVLHEPYVVDAAKVLERPTVSMLKELVLGRGYVAGEARHALEELNARAEWAALDR